MKIYLDTEFDARGFTISPISIGLVTEYRNEFYAEYEGYDWNSASKWLEINVKPHIMGNTMPVPEIAKRIIEFVGDEEPEWWCNYGAYDFVVLCETFGGLMSLPNGWPQYYREMSVLPCPNVIPEFSNGSQHNALSDAKEISLRHAWLMESAQ